MNEKELEMRRAARDKREQEWAKKKPGPFLYFFLYHIIGLIHFQRNRNILVKNAPRRSYYLYGDYEAELDFDYRHQTSMDEKAERHIRLEAYQRALETFAKTNFRPYETPNTLTTFIKERRTWRQYVLKHPEDTDEAKFYHERKIAELTFFTIIAIFLVIFSIAIFCSARNISDITSNIYPNAGNK